MGKMDRLSDEEDILPQIQIENVTVADSLSTTFASSLNSNTSGNSVTILSSKFTEPTEQIIVSNGSGYNFKFDSTVNVAFAFVDEDSDDTVGNDVTVVGSDYADTLSFGNENGADFTNLSVDGGKGDDSISFDSADLDSVGVFGGNGNGNDTITFTENVEAI